MKKLIKANLYFFIPYTVFLLICIILLASYSKPGLHILFNKAHSSFFDIFFKYATWLGNGAVVAVLFIILIFVSYRYAFAFLTGSLATALVVNLFKKVIFHHMYRPSKYFELYETDKLHLVEGVKMHSLQSFPSGHTATAFNLFIMLALIVKSNTLKFVFFIMAALVAYSRIYLSQHFLMDITAGSVVGVTVMALVFVWFEKFNKNWLDLSVFTRSKDGK